MERYFDYDELIDLMASFGIDHEQIKGETKHEKAREFVEYMQRRSKEVQLIDRLRQLRPLVEWIGD